MGIFRPYQRDTKSAAPAEPTPAPSVHGKHLKKSAPTPSRREAEAARRERLNPTLTPKERKRAERLAQREQRVERMTRIEAAPEKSLLRDHVDAKWHVTEFVMPVMILMMAASLMVKTPDQVRYVTFLMYAILALFILDVWLTWRSYKALATQRLRDPQFKGLVMYMINRMIQIRRFRVPGPRIKRGEQF